MRRSGAGFRNLKVWQKGMEATKQVYKVTRQFPKDELYGLTSQLRRAANSVPMNIAEGYKRRRHPRAYINALNIAKGSAGETETAIEIAIQLEYLPQEKAGQILDLYDEIGAMLDGLINRIEEDSRKNGPGS